MSNRARWIAIGLLGCVSQGFSAETAACDPWAAKIVSIQGVVEARHSTTDSWQAVTLSAVYCSGDSIRVAENSRAAVVLANQTLLRLDQNSSITLTAIKADSPSLLDILTGWVHFISRVPRSLQVNTPFVNAAIEGTEFVVAVDKDQGSVTVFEGKVRASNATGEVSITHNETAVAKQGEAPQKVLRAKPRDAVQWALYYPPIFAPGDPLAPAADLLYHGRVEAARQALAPFAGTPDNAKAKALLAIIAVVNNDTAQALEHAKQAVAQAPKVAATHIALSYAQQAQFDLDAALASARQAVLVEPNNALAYARLAELQLSVGYLHDALDSAQHAVQLDPKQARAHTILGFAYLTQIHIGEALQTFNTAIELDQADPLPRLGLGLAKIRKNDLVDGRREIEIAALLDPNNALIRSYLGKAYFEEKRPPLDADQFAMAKELDPNDPTPWFYDAIRKQTENRPVEALEDLQKSIELNDNRAVYRSRLQLDQDTAVRSASQARIYNDLGFQELGLNAGWQSVSTDPANYSGHRLLADSYSAIPGHEIARVSELLQSQLLQPLTNNPIQPHLAIANIKTFDTFGPADSSLGEYNSLFTRNDTSYRANGLVGSNNTLGDDLIISGVSNSLGYSFGQYHYETDGFRPNNDLNQNIYNAFVQSSINNNLDLQLEYRKQNAEFGDLAFVFDPNAYTNDRYKLNRDYVRFGAHYKVSDSENWILSTIYQNSKIYDNLTENFDLFPGNLNATTEYARKSRSLNSGLQYIRNYGNDNLVLGLGSFDDKIRYSLIETDITTGTGIFDGTDIFPYFIEENEIKYDNAYLFNTITILDRTKLTIGLEYTTYDTVDYHINKINPKIGASWGNNSGTTARIAYIEDISRPLNFSQTIEPSQIAGFNQLFDDHPGSKTKRYGIAVDQRFSNYLNAGFEFTSRNLVSPRTDEAGYLLALDQRDEKLHRLHLDWIPAQNLSIQIGLNYKKETGYYISPTELITKQLPLEFNYTYQHNWFSSLITTHVSQDYTNYGSSANDEFQYTNAAIGYYLPHRTGFIKFSVTNLFNSKFNYFDPYLYSFSRDPHISEYIPERQFFIHFVYTRL